MVPTVGTKGGGSKKTDEDGGVESVGVGSSFETWRVAGGGLIAARDSLLARGGSGDIMSCFPRLSHRGEGEWHTTD